MGLTTANNCGIDCIRAGELNMDYYQTKARLKTISDKVERLKWRKKELTTKKKAKVKRKKEVSAELADTIEARELINKSLDITHKRIKVRIDALLSLAINSVFDRPFSFELLIEKKYNRISCTPVIKEGEEEYFPKDEMGGGIIDIISFAFRVVLWSLEHPRSRNVFVLDEPMKFVGKGDMLIRAGNILRELSHRLGFQLIIVTHEKELSEIGDRAYLVEHNNGISEASMITID